MAQSEDRARKLPPVQPGDLSYEEARAILERATDEAKQALARRSSEPEILSYLARDPDGSIRTLVAGNLATPPDVDLRLADDELEGVRIELAGKIARLIPDVNREEAARLGADTLAVLEKLAHDRLPRVRQIVAEVIHSIPDVPRELAIRLAQDVELAVAAPILEYSPLLADEDLLEVIATTKVEGVLAAIARRQKVSGDVSAAIVASLDIPAITALLTNKGAKIRAKTLDEVISHAVGIEALHEPLVLRPELSIRAIKRISGFVAASLLDALTKRHDIDEPTRANISRRVRARIQAEDPVREAAQTVENLAWQTVAAAYEAGRLDDDFVLEAIAAEDWQRVELSLVALAHTPQALIERILKSGSGTLITALTWHCGLQMRTAYALQKDYARLKPNLLLPARGGTDFPLSEAQMRGQLELLGISERKD